MKPTVGRIVHFRETETSPVKPAIVIAHYPDGQHDMHCDLHVFPTGHNFTIVPFDDHNRRPSEPRWSWPLITGEDEDVFTDSEDAPTDF